jgi:hypothetical protein
MEPLTTKCFFIVKCGAVFSCKRLLSIQRDVLPHVWCKWKMRYWAERNSKYIRTFTLQNTFIFSEFLLYLLVSQLLHSWSQTLEGENIFHWRNWKCCGQLKCDMPVYFLCMHRHCWYRGDEADLYSDVPVGISAVARKFSSVFHFVH